MGTAELACASLTALHQWDGAEVVAVVTQPDRPRGRKLQPQPSFVKQCAEDLDLSVQQPETLRDEAALESLAELKPDLIVVTAFGQILPAAVLEIPPRGCLNVHTSLLPRHRGAAPIQWAILEGDRETGVTIMQMDEGLDTGPIVAMKRTSIDRSDNAQTLHDRLAAMGAKLLVESLPGYLNGELQPRSQPNEGATYARKIKKADGRIDWGEPATALLRRIRAFTPWPGAFTEMPTTELPRLKIWEAELAENDGQNGQVIAADESGIMVACGEQSLRLKIVQREGGQQMAAADFLRGCPLEVGTVLGVTSFTSSQL
jgi:methionyl-tRNA formyltransferase